MTDDRQKLLDAIRRNRSDNLVRLAYADFLQERGLDPSHEALIRHQIDPQIYLDSMADEISRLTAISCPRRPEWNNCGCERCREFKAIYGREHSLIHEESCRFLGPTGWWAQLKFDRGFLSQINLKWKDWFNTVVPILPQNPGLADVVIQDNIAVEWNSGPGYVKYSIPETSLSIYQGKDVLTTGDAIGAILKREWGGSPENGGYGIKFHMSGYRGRYDSPIGQLVHARTPEETADQDYIVRQIITDYGADEEALRNGRIRLVRLSHELTGRKHPNRCEECGRPIGIRQRTRQRHGNRYRTGDSACPECGIIYFSIRRVEES